MSESYVAIKALHSTLPAFRPPVPTALLPYIALVALALFFALTFTFTALRRTSNPLPEFGIALTASTLAGAGVVALFCTVGVYI